MGKILIIDNIELKELLKDYQIIEANNINATTLINKHLNDIALILLKKDNYEILNYLKINNLISKIAVMVFGDDLDNIDKAYQLGASDHIVKPYLPIIILNKIDRILNYNNREKTMTSLLNSQVYEKYKNNDMMTLILSHILETRNGESGLHIIHIKMLTKRLLEVLLNKTDKYNLSVDDAVMIETASALHDIGKISISTDILNKPGTLTKEERAIMKTHTTIGANLLSNLPFYQNEPLIKYAYDICKYHHERYDGNGYPEGLKGDDIPIAAQVVSIVDAYDALISKRVYKEPIDGISALKMIEDGKCGIFNPLLIECLKEIQPSIKEELQKNYFFEQRDYIDYKTDKLIKEKGL